MAADDNCAGPRMKRLPQAAALTFSQLREDARAKGHELAVGSSGFELGGQVLPTLGDVQRVLSVLNV